MTRETFDPAGFLEVARSMLDRSDQESFRRTAANRAYYTCYHLALLSCQRKWSWSQPAAGGHRAVIRKLRDQRQHYLSERLADLLHLRESADYAIDSPFTESDSRQAVDIANDLVPRLRSL